MCGEKVRGSAMPGRVSLGRVSLGRVRELVTLRYGQGWKTGYVVYGPGLEAGNAEWG